MSKMTLQTEGSGRHADSCKLNASGHHGKAAAVLWFALETKTEAIRNCPCGSAMRGVD
jgi:hypothetical protein